MATQAKPERERPIPQVGELYVLKEILVRCLVRIEEVTLDGDFVGLRVLVLPSDLHAGSCAPEIGETVTLGYHRHTWGMAFRLVPFEEEERPRRSRERAVTE